MPEKGIGLRAIALLRGHSSLQVIFKRLKQTKYDLGYACRSTTTNTRNPSSLGWRDKLNKRFGVVLKP
jgi:hypothetical protein